MEPQFKLLLIGGGHAMIPMLKDPAGVAQNDVEITLINDHQFIYYSGMIPEYMGDVYKQSEIRIDLKKLCEEAGIRFVQDIVTTLYPEKKNVQTLGGQLFSYDVVVFDIGSRTPGDYDQKKSIPTKPLYNIENLKRYLNDHSKSKIVSIIGGGSAGTEVALNISSRYQEKIKKDRLTIHVIEAAENLLPMFSGKLSRYVTSILEEHGVHIHLATKPREIVEDQITLSNGETIKSEFIFWATGSSGHLIFKEAGLPVDKDMFIKVNNHLQCITFPEIFAVGDCANIVKQPNNRKAGVHAVKQGPLLKENLTRAVNQLRENGMIHSKELKSYKPYPINPLIISTGHSEAIWISDGIWFHGSLMLRLKHFIDKRWIGTYLTENPFNESIFKLADTTNASQMVDEEILEE